jgi:Ser/Thr protein kinase RdoA (MazF antagonist)
VAARQAESGFVNENWILDTARGRYFLKCRHPDLRNRTVIAAQHALVEHLRGAGFPAPAIVPTAEGARILSLDGQLLELQEYIEHSPYDHRCPAHFDAAARTLARYHRCIETFACETLKALGALYSPQVVANNTDRLAQAWDLSTAPALSPTLQRLREHGADLERRFAAHGALTHLVIHGDYYADNLLFSGQRIVGVVDYDKASWQPRVAELAEVLIYFASPRPGHMTRIVYPGVLKWRLIERFLDQYAVGFPVSEAEARALPDYVRAVWVSMSLLRLAEHRPRPTWAATALGEVLTLADWAQVNAGRLVELIS